MGLRICDIQLTNFRSYERFALEDLSGLTILTGRNGVGKTNVLEAVQLMTAASSFRHPQTVQLIREGASNARVLATLSDGSRSIDVGLALEAGKKRYTVNGKPKQVADVKGALPAVVFVPDDLQLAKKSSSVKRSALDELGSQLTRNYHVVLNDYEKTLRYKNRLLKDEAPADLLAAINETLVTCGAQLFCYRVALFTRLVPLVRENYARISAEGERFDGAYLPSWDHLAGQEVAAHDHPLGQASVELKSNGAPDRDHARMQLFLALERYGEDERRRHRSLVGPHNDKIGLYLSGRDAAVYASQGQQRTVVLAWKLAEVELVRQTLGTNPVLLLDDVMSELDEARRNTLVGFADRDIQTFITATDLAGFNEELLEHARIVEL